MTKQPDEEIVKTEDATKRILCDPFEPDQYDCCRKVLHLQHFLSLMYCHQCDGTDYELLSNKGLKSKISYSEGTINCFGPYLYCKSTKKYSDEQCLGITNNCTDNEKCAIFLTNNYTQPHNGHSLSNIWKNPLMKEVL